jgi:hypothetical protein
MAAAIPARRMIPTSVGDGTSADLSSRGALRGQSVPYTQG